MVIYGNNQNIVTHHNKKRHLWTICMLVYISPSLVKEIASVKTKCCKYLVPEQFTHPFYFDKN